MRGDGYIKNPSVGLYCFYFFAPVVPTWPYR